MLKNISQKGAARREELARLSGEKIPVQLSKLQNAPVRFTDVLDKEEMGESILENL